MKRFQIYPYLMVLSLGLSAASYAEHTDSTAGGPPPVEQQIPATIEPSEPSTTTLPVDPAAAPASAVPMKVDKNACKEDAKKFCTGVRGGGGRIWHCLKQNEATLTPACQAHLQQMKDRLEKKKEQISEACQADKDQFCKDILPGNGRIARCMKEHQDQLSPVCRDTLKKMRAQAQTKSKK
jgi:hypothetical protein